MKEEKRLIRKAALEERSKLSADEVREKSSAIVARLMTLGEFIKSELIMCYVDFRNEVRTREFICDCLLRGKRVAVPKTIMAGGRQRTLAAVEIKDFENELEKCSFGILEPKNIENNKICPKDIDLVVVPGIAFDTRRYRIGYGMGYYDNFLKEVRSGCFKVGLAYDFQVYPEIPEEEHDVPLDLIITESRII